MLKFKSKLISITDNLIKDKVGWVLNNSMKDQKFLEIKFFFAKNLLYCFSYKIVNDMLEQKVEFAGCKNPIKATLMHIEFL